MNRIGLIVGGMVLTGVSALVARKLRATAPVPETLNTLEQEIEAEFVVEDDEAAHHILGHLAAGNTWNIVSARLSHLVIGAKNELAADAYAFKACLAAGYPRDEVMKIWDVMAHYAEDYGYVDDDADQRSFLEKVSGHPSLVKRRAALAEIR